MDPKKARYRFVAHRVISLRCNTSTAVGPKAGLGKMFPDAFFEFAP